MTTLYLCEKPSQARDIARVLGATRRAEGTLTGKDVIVTWCIGHLLEMAPPDRYDPALKPWRFDTLPILPDGPLGGWRMDVTPRGKKQFAVIQSGLKRAGRVVIATDADREGEVIAREILERCHWQGPISRLWLSALDDASIRKALKALRPGDATEPLYQAGLARARADWLVGMNLTRAYTLRERHRGGDDLLSVGRVQTPTLKLVVDRDRAIEQFKPVPYFVLIGRFSTPSGAFRATWAPDPATTRHVDAEGRCLDQRLVEDVARRLLSRQADGQPGRIDTAQTERRQEPPPLPFSLSSLQQTASKRWGLSPQKVLDAAQSLYETHKATTYPRTDCNYLPFSQHGEAGNILASLAQSDPRLTPLAQRADATLRSRCWNDKKITAHHAIIPTAAVVDVQALSDVEFKLYDIIRRHYLAQFYPPCEYDQTVIEVLMDGERFRTTGRVPRVEGWRAVLGGAAAPGDKEASLPAVEAGQPARLDHTEIENKTTKPPPRFTEGTLIQAMKTVGRTVTDPRLKAVLKETAGIGTEATRASILETLIERAYLVRQKKNLVSTPLGRALIDAVPDTVKDPATTAVWEQQLDAIARGKGDLAGFVQAQAAQIQQLIDALRAQPPAEPATAGPPCPACGKPLRLRRARRPKPGTNGKFWGCSAYPDCTTTVPDDNGKPGVRTAAAASGAGAPCPACGKPLVVRKGRNGPFLGCSGYPGCRHTQAVDGAARAGRKPAGSPRPAAKPGAGKPCPDCGTGQLVQRTVKNGGNAGKPFIGCTNFPDCRHFAWPGSNNTHSATRATG
ncbi:MAG TPA: DNA topoisomerase III [Gammaproteobacteria bacterium]|nr:DNA topoisomerase III [Gammaproteobacteria bacterium]